MEKRQRERGGQSNTDKQKSAQPCLVGNGWRGYGCRGRGGGRHDHRRAMRENGKTQSLSGEHAFRPAIKKPRKLCDRRGQPGLDAARIPDAWAISTRSARPALRVRPSMIGDASLVFVPQLK